MATHEEYEKMSAAEKKKEDWMNTKWRPMMGWSYMLTCIADFVVFPVLWSVIQMIGGGEVRTQWQPITLQGAGLYHIAMGAVLGIAAFGRTQEKLNDKAGPTLTAPISAPAPSFGNAPLGGNTMSTAPTFKPTPSFGAPTTVSSTGKAMPVQPEQPEL
jgi:hypothetical protein